MSRARKMALGAVLAGVAVAVAGVGLAVATTGNPTIYACAAKVGGFLRAVNGPGACRSWEYPLQWNKEGPPGLPGGGIDVYEASGLTRTVLAGAGPVSVGVLCEESGDTAISGGFEANSVEGSTGDPQLMVLQSVRRVTDDGEGWFIYLRPSSPGGDYGSDFTFRPFAMCVRLGG